MKKTVLLILCILCLLTSLPGCDSSYQEEMSFTCLLPQNIDTLDPQIAARSSSYLVISSLFQGLCRIDAKGNVKPGAARKWSSNENHTEFTFHLYTDSRWSNGEPVTANDFLFAIQRALRPETATPSVDDLFIIQGARAIYNGEADESQLGVWVKDDYTLIVQLEKSYPDFPALTAGTHYMPCNQAFFEACAGHYGLSSEYLITNGPFTFPTIYAWNTDYGTRKVELEPSDSYRKRQDVAPASLTFLIDYDDAYLSDPVSALVNGQNDIATLTETAAKEANRRGCGIQVLDDAITGLLLNPEADELKSPQTREVFIKTLDRQELLNRRMDKNSAEAMGIMADCVRWGGEYYYADGVAMFAQQDDAVMTEVLPELLKSLKEKNLPSITVICPDDEESINIANGLLICWNSKLGNAYNIQPLPDAEFQERIAAGDYQAAIYTLRAGGTIPYQTLKAFESTSTPALLKSPEYDTMLHSLSFDLSSYRELESYLQNQYLFYPLFSDKSYYVSSPNSKGILASPDLTIDFSGAKKKE
ncbi:peptide ABC transporter substrate-binding protein [Oscillospiraceae bacterium 42-9]